MANVIFKKCVADSTYLTPKAKYDSLVPHDEGTFYLVGEELYLGDVLLSANIAAEIGVEDVAAYFTGTTVEAVLAELYEAQLAKTIYITEDSTSVDYAKIYSIYQGSAGTAAVPVAAEKIADINIPKDLVVKSGSVVDIVFVEGTGGDPDTLHEGSASGPDVTEFIKGSETPTEADAGKYIKLVIANNEATPLYIAAKSLVDIYTGGATAEATVAIDANNEITVTINKVASTKIVYQAEAYVQVQSSETYDSTETYYTYDSSTETYSVDDTVDETNFADKVAAGLYTHNSEINVKQKIDQVESDLIALNAYVGEIPSTSQATDVIGYVQEQTQGGVGALNGEAVIATKNAVTNVVTLKGGVVETAGIIENSATAPKTTVIDGYKNPLDGEFYAESTYETKITPDVEKSYKDLADVAEPIYNWTGYAYVLVRTDIGFAAVAVTGAAEDVSYDNTTSQMIATNVQDAIDELSAQLTWNEV